MSARKGAHQPASVAGNADPSIPAFWIAGPLVDPGALQIGEHGPLIARVVLGLGVVNVVAVNNALAIYRQTKVFSVCVKAAAGAIVADAAGAQVVSNAPCACDFVIIGELFEVAIQVAVNRRPEAEALRRGKTAGEGEKSDYRQIFQFHKEFLPSGKFWFTIVSGKFLFHNCEIVGSESQCGFYRGIVVARLALTLEA